MNFIELKIFLNLYLVARKFIEVFEAAQGRHSNEFEHRFQVRIVIYF